MIKARSEVTRARVHRQIDKSSKQNQRNPPSFDTLTHTTFSVRSIPAVQPRSGWNISTCTLLLDTSNMGGAFKHDNFIGFVDGPEKPPAKFEDITERHCLIYRVIDISSPRPLQEPRLRLQQGAAILTGIGPIDGDSAEIFSRYAEEIDIAILVNRLCFARRESMDLLFIAGTKSFQHGQSALALKAKGVMAALKDYAVVVWVDMDGIMPLAARPASRTCVPFSACWPHDTQILLPRAPIFPHNPSSAFMLFRRSSRAFSFLSATLNSPSRSSQSEEVVLADAVLSALHELGGLVYSGQCSRPEATLACWSDVFVNNQRRQKDNSSAERGARLAQEWHEPVGGIRLAGAWCDVEAWANLSLVCPCSSSPSQSKASGSSGSIAASGWCGQNSEAGSLLPGSDTADNPAKGKGVCDISRCNDIEVLLVKFGPGAHFMARGPEVLFQPELCGGPCPPRGFCSPLDPNLVCHTPNFGELPLLIRPEPSAWTDGSSGLRMRKQSRVFFDFFFLLLGALQQRVVVRVPSRRPTGTGSIGR